MDQSLPTSSRSESLEKKKKGIHDTKTRGNVSSDKRTAEKKYEGELVLQSKDEKTL